MSAVDEKVKSPSPRSCVSDSQWLSLYRHLFAAREIDRFELEYVRRGLAFFHVSGAGHEATAALGPHLVPEDWLHCHYRDKALLLARGVPIREFFLSLFCKAASHSAGRQMSAHLSAPALHVLSMVGPVGNNALQAVGIAAELRSRGDRGIVLCSVGDGTTQEGEFLEAVAEAVRDRLPVLFLIQDNGWAISTPTEGQTLFSRPGGAAREFYGMPIERIDGRDPVGAHRALGTIVERLRRENGPSLVWMRVERLTDHSNADDQSEYRDEADVERALSEGDPVANLRRHLVEIGVDPHELFEFERAISVEVSAAAEEAAGAPDPTPVFTAKRPLPERKGDTPLENPGPEAGTRLSMGAALRETLRRQLQNDSRVVLFGEDIADPKGDVFGVTRGLSTEFPGRVRNSPLSEATIVGVSIGRALAGARPVAFLQFADFLPLAWNQIVSELASLYWRTDGAWQAPVIVFISCGGYRPGLGPFHSQTLESAAAHLPGVDVVMPSTAADAAGLLNAAFASGRPTLFFYPKSCLNLSEHATSNDVGRQFVPLGASRIVRAGDDITFVSWGYPVFLCQKAASALAEAGVEAEVIDLRSLSPWDDGAVRESAEKTGRLIVVHEDNQTCGFGAEVVSTVVETSRRPIVCRRVARPDTWVPCHFPSQLEVLPSFRRVLTVAAELLGLELAWENECGQSSGTITIDAIGSGPADETVIVTEVLKEVGETVSVGDVIAVAEAEKSIVEISANVAGVVAEVLVAAGDAVPVGKPIMAVRTGGGQQYRKAITEEQSGRPILKHKPASPVAERRHESKTAARTSAFREVPISARQRVLNRRMEQSQRSLPQGLVTNLLAWEKVTGAARCLRSRHPELGISEFDVLAFCAAQSAGGSPRLRSVLAGEQSLREYARLNLGIAVHLAGEELATAVIPGADQLSFADFLTAMHTQIQRAQNGEDQASHDTQLMITHLGGLPITNAAPVVIAPAAGVLFIGAPASTAEASMIHLTLAFDHRILNGVAAARFLAEIGRRLDQLQEGNGDGPERPDDPSAGTLGGNLRDQLQAAAAGQRRRLLENQIGRMVASLLKIDAGQVDFGQPLRNQGLDSLEGTELAFLLERALAIPVPPTLVWNHPTITAIAAHLAERLGMRIAVASHDSNGGSPPLALVSEIKRLTEDQVRILLGALPDTPGPTR